MADTLVTRDDGLVTVTFNRPDKKNALNATNWRDLDEVLREVEVDPADRALLITGADGNFSSGADLGGGLSGDIELSTLTGKPRQGIVHEMRFVNRIINRLHRLPKPTLAAVDGVAVGVGLGVALACDLIVASDRARFSSIFVKLGLALDGGTSWTMPRQIGQRRAKQMAYFGDMVSAADAEAWGLVNEVVAADDLAATAEAWGRRLAEGPTTAIGLMKNLIDSSDSLTFEQALEAEGAAQHIAGTTEDKDEGILSFKERRAPRFMGR